MQDAKKMLNLLKLKQSELATIQKTTRSLLEKERFVINALIPKAETPIVSVPAPASTSEPAPVPTVVPTVVPTPAPTPSVEKTPDITKDQFTQLSTLLKNKN